jgi:hypothetical protein
LTVLPRSQQFAATAGQTTFTLAATPSAIYPIRLEIADKRIRTQLFFTIGPVLTYAGPALTGGELVFIDYFVPAT